jgi:fatty acid desaturase
MKTRNESVSSDIYGCDRSIAELLKRRSIPREEVEAIRRLHRLDERYNWMIVFFFAMWICAGWLVLTVENIVLEAIGYFLIACSINGLPTFMHEACHSTLFKNKMLNRWVGFLCGLPGLVSVSAYRSIHLVHHSTTKTEKDPDNIENSARKSIPLVFVYYVVLLAGIYIYILTVPFIGFQKAQARVKSAIVLEYVLLLSIYAGAFILIPFGVILHVWIIPLLIAGQLSNVRGLAEHGLTSSGNEFIDTRTVVSNRFVRFMMCNLNYHLEHHLFPGIPWYNLASVHSLLEEEYRKAGSSVYRSYFKFLGDFIRTTLHGVIPGVRMIPAHIREEVCL